MTLTLEQEQILARVSRFTLTAMAGNDPAHDGGHVQRVVRLTRQLCSRCEADIFRAELLAWLHDLNDDKLVSNLGAASISGFLKEIGVDNEDIDFIMQAIPYISYRKHPKLSPDIPLEIRLVQDADRIDAMGAIGIARTFAYGGAKGRSLEDSLAHFDEKLLKLYDLLGTEAGRELASSRRDILVQFYHQFKEEW